METKKITKYGLIMALYIVLSLVVPELGYGPIQFRISEVLTLLAFIDSGYVLPLTLACAIVNIWSPFGIVDVIFGSLASFLALTSMTKTKNIYIASLFPALFSVIIGLEILFLSNEPINFFLVTAQIMLSEIVIVTIIGVPVFKSIMKNNFLMDKLLLKD
ncbi:MAG TPA: QueT transporter family protein [Tissierellaceae bacterium]